ncbi:MAG: nucleoside 2-deoxyribosyltransferase [Clostridiales bacterium]|nr:nucleoside 2-deoxyribosyltransferase [Clostridiales bacterium]
MKKIYIAGFDVFYEDAAKRGEKMKEICRRYGFSGLYPLDNECESSRDIFKGNLSLIDEADIICANLNDFRGKDADSGTAFEIGYGFAKGKSLYGYKNSCLSLREAIGEKDEEGFNVEDFGLNVNLMIGECCKIITGDFENCIKEIKKDFAE